MNVSLSALTLSGELIGDLEVDLVSFFQLLMRRNVNE